MATLALHQHGKSRVRVGRVWREGNVHTFAEFKVATMLESAMEHAFLTESNEGMTPTDTQKNIVYLVAKQMKKPCGPEEFALALAKHFVTKQPLVSKAKVSVEMEPWKRITVNGVPHEHGYQMTGTEVRTGYATYDTAGRVFLLGGVKDLKVLKTTQSGYVGFLHDKYTTLPDVTDRIVATSVTSTWKYSSVPPNFDAAFEGVKAGFSEAFYGPARGGVYSPSVQFTLYRMGENAIKNVPQVESVFLNMPNLHFVPVKPVTSTFEDDVFVATSEPHGNIEAVVTRRNAAPHAKL